MRLGVLGPLQVIAKDCEEPGKARSAKGPRMRRSLLTGAAVLLAAVLAACSSSPGSAGSSGSADGGPSGTLTISNASGTEWNCSFNPFSPGNLGEGLTLGQVYEPLMFVDTLQNAKVSPWLASGYAWSNGNKTLTFTIRKGVTFSDGKPMTAADVAFTFNLLKKFPVLDVNSV
jgi:peptide/nickel transport system substrate-binding protein